MPLKVDYTQVKTFEALPKGDYPATFTSWEVKDAADSPYPNLVGEFTFDEDSPNDAGGRKIKRYWTSNPDGADFFRRDMIALGEDPDTFKGPKAKELDMEQVAQTQVGEQCVLRIDADDKYDGSMRNNIKAVKPRR